MARENLHEPFSITCTTVDICPKADHQHNFFELVYILNGTGAQCINKNRFDYHADHMFLITPEDCHSFEIKTTTTFFFLRFNNIYLDEAGLLTDNVQRLEFILQNANHRPGCILKNLIDKTLVRPIVEAIVREQENHDLYDKELIKHLVNTLIIVVARNIARYQQLQVSEQTDARAMDLLHYIQANIYYPDKLRTENLSAHFNISETYLGRYFKTHTNETMQQYITGYKLKLIEHRLQHSDKRINEIAAEFNFTDESHFNKFFKKQKGESPGAFRIMARAGG